MSDDNALAKEILDTIHEVVLRNQFLPPRGIGGQVPPSALIEVEHLYHVIDKMWLKVFFPEWTP